jgi:hypothetical protein
MPYLTLLAGGFSLAMLAAGNLTATETDSASLPTGSYPVVDAAELRSLDTGLNPFPSRAMAEQFADYLQWTKAQGLSRLAAFEALMADADEQGASDRSKALAALPSQAMAEQFDAYLRWTEEQQLSPFYAFKVTNFD